MLVRRLATAAASPARTHHKVLVVGGGTAGVGVATQILKLLQSSGKSSYTSGDIAIVDAAEWHHYQPGWTLVGSGLKNKADLRRPLASLVETPTIAHHVEKIQSFSPENNFVKTVSGKELTYETLVVAPGLQVKYNAIENLPKALADPSSGVSSIYSYDTCDKVWADIDALRQGQAIFTQPAGGIKCAGAPQKIMWMAWDHWRRTNRRDNIKIDFISGMPTMFSVPKYSEALNALRIQRGIGALFTHDLKSIDLTKRVATFKTPDGKVEQREYDFLHVVPPQGPHEFVQKSPLADAAGWVDLGNYLGALSNWVAMQNTAAPIDTVIYCSVGYHAITLPQDPKALLEDRMNTLASLLAIGIDPQRSILFHQDQSKLAVVRNANTENEVNEGHLNLGLLAYPVLQAADILLYRATHVPVGEDQQQHLELSRDLADLFNRTYNAKIFPLPQHIITPAKRILSLRDPTQKMSKSAPNVKSRILITDDFDHIQAKVRAAVTDSTASIWYDPKTRPGVGNLLTILSACGDTSETAEQLASRYVNKSHSDLKKDVAEAIEFRLQPIREEYTRIRGDEGWLREVSREGIRKAREIATRTMEVVKGQLGLGPI
ncbi:hypothetical protein FRB99_007873 [Tulasnella sp. 403]|nr:hypothetical protein FRB99_007873 [Tulasnella sp. 403]